MSRHLSKPAAPCVSPPDFQRQTPSGAKPAAAGGGEAAWDRSILSLRGCKPEGTYERELVLLTHFAEGSRDISAAPKPLGALMLWLYVTLYLLTLEEGGGGVRFGLSLPLVCQ